MFLSSSVRWVYIVLVEHSLPFYNTCLARLLSHETVQDFLIHLFPTASFTREYMHIPPELLPMNRALSIPFSSHPASISHDQRPIIILLSMTLQPHSHPQQRPSAHAPDTACSPYSTPPYTSPCSCPDTKFRRRRARCRVWGRSVRSSVR